MKNNEDILKKINYYEKYYAKGFRNFEEKSCLMCDYIFEAPTSIKNITTCSEYCKGLKISKQKSKGGYIQCRVCDKPVWALPSKLQKKQYCSKKCADLGTTFYSYERNIIRGKYKKYYGENWNYQRKKVRERENYCCKDCNITEKELGKQLSIHHIKPFLLFSDYREANKLSNLVGICEPCHRKRHKGENHHSNYLK